MKTYSVKPSEITRKWYVIDASEKSLGRVSTKAATLLLGKAKPMFSHHIDCGDYVVIVNAKNLVVTGKKENQKMYYSHSGYPGGLKEMKFIDVMANNPSDILFHAVRGMLPVNKLRAPRLARLKIYNDSDHEHLAQKPIVLSLGSDK